MHDNSTIMASGRYKMKDGDPKVVEMQDADLKGIEMQQVDKSARIGNVQRFKIWVSRMYKCSMCGLALVVLACLAMVLVTVLYKPRDLQRGAQQIFQNQLGSFLGVGLRNDDEIQECNAPHLKKTFPDVDYAMLGYNILKGYPLAIGHDPGLTHPIFKADYSGHLQSADCRYSVPHGYTIIPDVSCVTSFSSEEVKTSYEFSKSLSVQASVEGGGAGVSFSASAGYSEAQSELSSKQSIYVLSTASCNYYYASLNKGNMPQFDDTFMTWAQKIAAENTSDNDIIKFVDFYGTHFLTDVKFGAKYIYQHKLSTDSFQNLSKSEYSVSVQASYSGAFSVGGGFGLSGSQQQAASAFSQKVETKTITVGAPPPANGDALTWASTVKNTPVPTEYKLEIIANLFTAEYMQEFNFPYDNVKQRLHRLIDEGHYCTYLHNKGLIDTCEDTSVGWVTIDGVRFDPIGSSIGIEAQESRCIDRCLKHNKCFSISVCDRSEGCKNTDHNCVLRNDRATYKTDQEGWKILVFTSKMRTLKQSYGLDKLWLESLTHRQSSKMATSEEDCKDACQQDPQCRIYNYCSRSDDTCASFQMNCLTYPLILNIERANIQRLETAILKFLD